MRLNVLVLHAMGDFAQARKTSVDHALCFSRYVPEHNYLYHDVNWPVTDALRRIRFHAIILDTTVLCIRYYRPRGLFYEEKERYRFLSESDAVRIAFPQDDYDHSDVLDAWLSEYRTDVVYSVVWDHRELLYPKMMRQGEILPALTGYVNDQDVARASTFAKPFAVREIDVGYRAKFLPPNFGRYGQLKGLIAEGVRTAAVARGLAVDISTCLKDVILSDAWLAFLGNCRWCPCSEGGSSVWDPDGAIMDKVRTFVTEAPDASFDEIEAACFPGQDGRYLFSAVSPRLFENALARAGQLLAAGGYLGVLRPGEHYLPLDETSDEMFRQMRDMRTATRLIEACYETLIATNEFRYSRHATRVMKKIEELVCRRRVTGSSNWQFRRLLRQHYLVSNGKVLGSASAAVLQRVRRRLSI